MAIKYGRPLPGNVITLDDETIDALTPSVIGDEDGNPVAVREGTQSSLSVQDLNATVLLSDILKELKKMNLHLSIMNDQYITNSEVK